MYKPPVIRRPQEIPPSCPPQIVGKKCCVYRNEDDSSQPLRYDCVDRNQVCPDRMDCWIKEREEEVPDCRCCGDTNDSSK